MTRQACTTKKIPLNPAMWQSTSPKHMNNEIESDEFLRNFFSIAKKSRQVPTPQQIKEACYSR
jgi:hypothetical protein